MEGAPRQPGDANQTFHVVQPQFLPLGFIQINWQFAGAISAMNGAFSRAGNRLRQKLGPRIFVVLIALTASGCGSFLDIFTGSATHDSALGETTTTAWQTTVLVETNSGHGTGAIISATTVLTAYHVVDQGISGVEFFGREYEPGEVVWFDRELDLAILRVDVPARYSAAELYCGELRAEQPLLAVGHPLTERWVSVEGHLGESSPLVGSPLMLLDIELSLGNSGGPVFDQNGRIVGIATAILVPVPPRVIPTASTPSYSEHQSGTALMLPANQFCERAALGS